MQKLQFFKRKIKYFSQLQRSTSMLTTIKKTLRLGWKNIKLNMAPEYFRYLKCPIQCLWLWHSTAKITSEYCEQAQIKLPV